MDNEPAFYFDEDAPSERPEPPEQQEPEEQLEQLEPQFTLPPISGFWRRFGAFTIDVLLLGIVGQIIALPARDVWFAIGPYGRFVGASLALLYFGLMDSGLSNGRTVGKLALGVAVRDSEGNALSAGKSILRTLVWLVPAMLNGWALPIFMSPVVGGIVSFLVFALGGAIVVTMIFNRRTRQGLHDLVLGTYVVKLGGPRIESFPRAGRLPWVLSGGIAVLAIVAMAVGGGLLTSALPLAGMTRVQEAVQADGRFFTASVMDWTYSGGSRPTQHVLQVTGWYKGVPAQGEREKVVNDIARLTLRNMAGLEKYDLVRAEVRSAYDLGFATGSLFYGDAESVQTWRERLGEKK